MGETCDAHQKERYVQGFGGKSEEKAPIFVDVRVNY
jgi:hypothetical protein